MTNKSQRAAAHELVSAVLFLPLVTASGLGVFALPWWARWVNRVAWLRARQAGAQLPDQPPVRGSRPLALFGVVLAAHLGAFVIVVTLGSLGIALLAAPLVVALAGGEPVYQVLGWHPTGPQGWVLVPFGLLALVCLHAALVRLAQLRFQLMAELADQEATQLVAQVQRLSASRATLVDAFEAERRRIERDLHDGAQQRLVGLAMGLGLAERQARQLAADEPRAGALAVQLAAAQDEIEQALAELRATVRGIHPQVLTDRGLFAAVADLADHSGLAVQVSTAGDDSLVEGPIAAAAYFVVSEALANVGKHAQIDRAEVAVRVEGDELDVEVRDRGRGGAQADRATSTGLRGLAERVESLGGRLELKSPSGAGTTVRARLPLVPSWLVEGE